MCHVAQRGKPAIATGTSWQARDCSTVKF